MTERGIILRAHEVLAILDGRLTQLRRPVNPQPRGILGPLTWEQGPSGRGPEWWSACEGRIRCAFLNRCPFGAPGGSLWVKEAWALHSQPMEGQGTGYVLQYRADESTKEVLLDSRIYPRGTHDNAPAPWPLKAIDKGWRHPGHIPRWASRITLKVIDVRVERLLEMREVDAVAEGSYLGKCPCLPSPRATIDAAFTQHWCHVHGEEFRRRWDSVYAKRGLGWHVNPWTWIVRVEVTNG